MRAVPGAWRPPAYLRALDFYDRTGKPHIYRRRGEWVICGGPGSWSNMDWLRWLIAIGARNL